MVLVPFGGSAIVGENSPSRLNTSAIQIQIRSKVRICRQADKYIQTSGKQPAQFNPTTVETLEA
jgi:hypothetical protein